MVIYFAYGRRYSVLARSTGGEAAAAGVVK
jgi:hypothetical protein